MNTFQIQKLSVSINGKNVLSDASFFAQSGSIHALMGPNGSGKSSLVYALAGHPQYNVISGSALLNKVEILEMPSHMRAKSGLFISFQYPQTLPGVNVFNFLKEAYCALKGERPDINEFRSRVLDVFTLIGLNSSFLDRSVNEGFSGGEKKRFEMAQLLLFKPTVAILDEIDSGLDVDALKSVGHALQVARNENPKMIIFLITHYQRILEYCAPDFVHILVDGMIKLSGDRSLAQIVETQGYDAFRV